jgi:hypothetical protein
MGFLQIFRAYGAGRWGWRLRIAQFGRCFERRRREIFVEPKIKNGFQAPAGAAYSDHGQFPIQIHPRQEIRNMPPLTGLVNIWGWDSYIYSAPTALDKRLGGGDPA